MTEKAGKPRRNPAKIAALIFCIAALGIALFFFGLALWDWIESLIHPDPRIFRGEVMDFFMVLQLYGVLAIPVASLVLLLRELLRRYGVCEPIDAAWTAELEALRAALPEAVERAGRRTTAYDAAAYDRIYGYILFRQLERLPEFGVEPLLDFARDACDFIFLSETLWGDLPERLRRWSEEIEYSTENVELLLHGNQFSEKIGVGEQSR